MKDEAGGFAMKCKQKDCKGQELVYLGGLISGVQLYGCPKCNLVYYWEPRTANEYAEQTERARNTSHTVQPVLTPA